MCIFAYSHICIFAFPHVQTPSLHVMSHDKKTGQQSTPPSVKTPFDSTDTSIQFGKFTPHDAPDLLTTFSPTKIDPFAQSQVVEESNPDTYPGAFSGERSATTTQSLLEPNIDKSILGDEGGADDLLLAF